MSGRNFDVHSISFQESGAAIAFMEIPSDVRVEGALIQTRQIQLHAGHPDYREHIEHLLAEVRKVLRDVLEDFEESQPFTPPTDDEDDEDDDRGMGT